MNTTTRPTCRADYTEAVCPICSAFDRIQKKARANGQVKQDAKASQHQIVSYTEKSQPPEQP